MFLPSYNTYLIRFFDQSWYGAHSKFVVYIYIAEEATNLSSRLDASLRLLENECALDSSSELRFTWCSRCRLHGSIQLASSPMLRHVMSEPLRPKHSSPQRDKHSSTAAPSALWSECKGGTGKCQAYTPSQQGLQASPIARQGVSKPAQHTTHLHVQTHANKKNKHKPIVRHTASIWDAVTGRETGAHTRTRTFTRPNTWATLHYFDPSY